MRWRVGASTPSWCGNMTSRAPHTVFCMCGPAPMMDDMTTLLAGMGVPASQIRFEHFETAVAATQVNAAVRADGRTMRPRRPHRTAPIA